MSDERPAAGAEPPPTSDERRPTSAPSSISREELLAKIERGDDFTLFEVLPTPYWRKHHLPGAKSLPPDQVRELVPRLVPDRDAEVVVYCWDDG